MAVYVTSYSLVRQKLQLLQVQNTVVRCGLNLVPVLMMQFAVLGGMVMHCRSVREVLNPKKEEQSFSGVALIVCNVAEELTCQL